MSKSMKEQLKAYRRAMMDNREVKGNKDWIKKTDEPYSVIAEEIDIDYTNVTNSVSKEGESNEH